MPLFGAAVLTVRFAGQPRIGARLPYHLRAGMIVCLVAGPVLNLLLP